MIILPSNYPTKISTGLLHINWKANSYYNLLVPTQYIDMPLVCGPHQDHSWRPHTTRAEGGSAQATNKGVGP